jgi:hypothetical protein
MLLQSNTVTPLDATAAIRLANQGNALQVTPAASKAALSLQDPELSALSQKLGADGSFDRSNMIQLLRNAGDKGSVDAAEFADLQAILSPSNPIAMPESVRVLATKVVYGDLAQLEKLVQKWFYGSDRPVTPYTYQFAAGTLFKDGVKETDVRQGIAIDCYLTAAVAGIAYRDPQAIAAMFTDNGDNTYTVRFFNSGVADYITVDRYFPSTRWGTFIYSNMNAKLNDPGNELWMALLEKAYAQINESGWIGQDGSNSYSGIAGGYVHDAIAQITNHAATTGELQQATAIAAFQAGEVVTLKTTSTASSASIVADHAYLVTGYDATTQKFSLYNPWGADGNKDSQGVFKPGRLELSWGEITSNFLYMTHGAV